MSGDRPRRKLSWRMPTEKQMRKLAAGAAAVGRNAPGSPLVGPGDPMPPEYWRAVLDDASADTRPTVDSIRQQQLCDKGGGLIKQADWLLCESWNERMWSDGEPIDPSPTMDQAIGGGYAWLENRMLTLQDPARRRPGHAAVEMYKSYGKLVPRHKM